LQKPKKAITKSKNSPENFNGNLKNGDIWRHFSSKYTDKISYILDDFCKNSRNWPSLFRFILIRVRRIILYSYQENNTLEDGGGTLSDDA
jgi:hypothetical protein